MIRAVRWLVGLVDRFVTWTTTCADCGAQGVDQCAPGCPGRSEVHQAGGGWQ